MALPLYGWSRKVAQPLSWFIGSVLLLGIPCMVSEFLSSAVMVLPIRHVPGPKLANGTAWKWVGYLEVLTGFLITGYYAVVSGWCLQYVYASIIWVNCMATNFRGKLLQGVFCRSDPSGDVDGGIFPGFVTL